MNKILPIITKEQFVEIISLIQKQSDKDHNFTDFMETYLDGRFIPTMNDHYSLAIQKLLNIIFNDIETDKYDMTWCDWFAYENNFGKNKMSCWLNEVEYVISTPEEFYDFMVLWMNLPKEK
jgi:hypothetical protein